MQSGTPVIGIRFTTLGGGEANLGIVGGMFVGPDGVTEWIEARHLYATSGLVDSHTHLGANSIGQMVESPTTSPETLRETVSAHLAGGVLAVADKGTRDVATLRVQKWDAADRPELQMAGRLIAPADGYYPGVALVAPGADLPEAVESVLSDGAGWVKLVGDWPRRGIGAIPNYAQDELRSAVGVAHASGARVAIHTAAPETPSLAVAAGVDSIEHGLFLTEGDLLALGNRGGAWVPTAAAMTGLAKSMKAGSRGRKLLNDGLGNVRELLAGAPGFGVHVLAGTDLHLPHGQVAAEAIELERFGLARADALAAVTSAAYAFFGFQRGLEIGMPADLVGFRANPRNDLNTLVDPALVIRCGRVVVKR